jgi:hypothetical protein
MILTRVSSKVTCATVRTEPVSACSEAVAYVTPMRRAPSGVNITGCAAAAPAATVLPGGASGLRVSIQATTIAARSAPTEA